MVPRAGNRKLGMASPKPRRTKGSGPQSNDHGMGRAWRDRAVGAVEERVRPRSITQRPGQDVAQRVWVRHRADEDTTPANRGSPRARHCCHRSHTSSRRAARGFTWETSKWLREHTRRGRRWRSAPSAEKDCEREPPRTGSASASRDPAGPARSLRLTLGVRSGVTLRLEWRPSASHSVGFLESRRDVENPMREGLSRNCA
jgi:hypothetical protein